MHLEFLVEDASGAKLVEILVPRILDDSHSWRIHPYRGIGRIPAGMSNPKDISNRILLDSLPKILQGYGRTPGIDAVVIVLDSDSRACKDFLEELHALLHKCAPTPDTLFRLAIEEIEAWYLGDRKAVLGAYPKAKTEILDKYEQDSVCGTWELLGDAIHPGGIAAIKKAGWPLPGQLKSEWAQKIGPLIDLDANKSPSFHKFKDGIRRMIS